MQYGFHSGFICFDQNPFGVLQGVFRVLQGFIRVLQEIQKAFRGLQ